MSILVTVNERDDELVWEHNLRVERRETVSMHAEVNEVIRQCINVYWELFASERVSACSIFSAINLLYRYCSTCVCTTKFQRIGAACLWIAMKLCYGQEVPMCARVLSCYWNDLLPPRSPPSKQHGTKHFRIKWRKVVQAELHVLRKLEYNVFTVTPHDMFVLLLRLHDKGNDSALFAKGVQMLITMTISREQITYLPSQIAVATALTCGLQVDGKYLVDKWQETFAWIQRFVQ